MAQVLPLQHRTVTHPPLDDAEGYDEHHETYESANDGRRAPRLSYATPL